MPSSDAPLHGTCSCGTVRFAVTAPFETAGYCHCTRCRRRSGAMWSLNAMVGRDGFRILRGVEEVTTWRPRDGLPKSFCRVCGGHLFSGEPEGEGPVGIRLGAVEGDPEIRPQWRQWLESAPDWEPIPDDGLPRFPRRRETG
jgi:hypothetical protein